MFLAANMRISFILLFCCLVGSGFAVKKSQDDWLGKDKFGHLGVATAFSVVGGGMAENAFGMPKGKGIYVGVSLTGVLSIAKEYRDDTGFSKKDLAYDLLGMLLGTIIYNQVK